MSAHSQCTQVSLVQRCSAPLPFQYDLVQAQGSESGSAEACQDQLALSSRCISCQYAGNSILTESTSRVFSHLAFASITRSDFSQPNAPHITPQQPFREPCNHTKAESAAYRILLPSRWLKLSQEFYPPARSNPVFKNSPLTSSRRVLKHESQILLIL